MRYVLAVSGGVDSVVMLHHMVKIIKNKQNLVVAHVNHGIRSDSNDDGYFVQKLTQNYGLKYYQINLRLGASASEELARSERYRFLFKLAQKHQSKIVTAHHLDDLVESVVINLKRGTGFRGLSVMNRKGIFRPMINFTKNDIYEYALKNRLEWVEDSTNRQIKYLRNQIRFQTNHLTKEPKIELLDYRNRQIELVGRIQKAASDVIGKEKYNRHLFIMVPENIALELLRQAICNQGLTPPTRPNLWRGLLAIKTFRPGKNIELSGEVQLRFSVCFFIVTTPIK